MAAVSSWMPSPKRSFCINSPFRIVEVDCFDIDNICLNHILVNIHGLWYFATPVIK
jgi:hypothetical protein